MATGYIKCVTGKLTALLVKCLAVPHLYFEAYPIDLVFPQSVELIDVARAIPPIASSSDTCIYKRNTLKIFLSQQSYSQCPGVLNIPNVTVTKVSQLKLGHGSRDMVAYHHAITVKFSETHTLIPASIARILDTIFGSSVVTLSTSTDSELATIVGPAPNSAYHCDATAPIDTQIAVSPLNCKVAHVSDDSLAPFYEYLSLLHRQSKQLQRQSINDYISTYEIPSVPHTQLWEHPLTQTRIQNTHPQVLATLLGSDWLLISLRADKFHVMLLRDKDNQVLSYEVERSQF